LTQLKMWRNWKDWRIFGSSRPRWGQRLPGRRTQPRVERAALHRHLAHQRRRQTGRRRHV